MAITLETNGLSYEILTPISVLQRIKENQDSDGNIRLITYHYYQMTPSSGVPVLVGFLNEIERDFFLEFIKVSGIGPRAAVKALNKAIGEIAQAIDRGDTKYLKSLPGIGEQKAKEIVAKLQGKMGKFTLMHDRVVLVARRRQSRDIEEEALHILLQLQYKKAEAEEMIKKAFERSPKLGTSEELLNEIYKQRKDIIKMDEQIQNYKSAIEAILFVSEKPVVLDQLKEVFPELKPSQIHDLIKQLQEEYVNREAGMVVVEIAGGFQMLSNSHAAAYIREFYKTKTKEKLSKPALESLAIIAYKQPVGRAEVEVIRGVNSDGTIAHLLNKGLIKITGRKEVPGRPFLYGTTKEFLEYFGLKSLEDLPKIEEFTQLGVDMPKAESLPVEEAIADGNRIRTGS